MSPSLAAALAAFIADKEPAIVVTIADSQGSTPRASGTRMAVTAGAIVGTVGGGHLEFSAIIHARRMLVKGAAHNTIEIVLGPAVGQCCGGRVSLALALADDAAVAAIRADEVAATEASPLVLLFGAGHVGRALAAALGPLPLRLLWADERADAFPDNFDGAVEITHDDWSLVMERAEAVAAVVVMTYDHGLDFEITEAALKRDDTAYVGLIGSRSKRASFESWFRKRGGAADALARLTSPIGDFGVADKRPEVIAALVATEIMQKVLTP